MKFDQVLKKLEQLEARGHGEVYRGYSGRGMFGAECLAFSCSFPQDLIAAAGIDGARIDNLGRDYIVYWPRLKEPTNV